MNKYKVNDCGVVINPDILVLIKGQKESIAEIRHATREGRIYTALSMRAHNKGQSSGVTFHENYSYENMEAFLLSIKECVIKYYSEHKQDEKSKKEAIEFFDSITGGIQFSLF